MPRPAPPVDDLRGKRQAEGAGLRSAREGAVTEEEEDAARGAGHGAATEEDQR